MRALLVLLEILKKEINKKMFIYNQIQVKNKMCFMKKKMQDTKQSQVCWLSQAFRTIMATFSSDN